MIESQGLLVLILMKNSLNTVRSEKKKKNNRKCLIGFTVFFALSAEAKIQQDFVLGIYISKLIFPIYVQCLQHEVRDL